MLHSITIAHIAVPLVTRGQLQPPPLSGTPGEDGVIAPGATGSGDPAAASMTYSQGPPTPPPRPHIHSRSLSVDLKSGIVILLLGP